MTLHYISQPSATESTGLAFSLPFARRLQFVPCCSTEARAPQSPSAPCEFWAGWAAAAISATLILKKTTISCCLNFPGDGINQNIWRMQGGGCPPPRGCPLGRGNPYVWASCVPKSCCLSVVPRMWWLREKEETSIPLEWLLGMRLWRRDYMCHLITKTVAL